MGSLQASQHEYYYVKYEIDDATETVTKISVISCIKF